MRAHTQEHDECYDCVLRFNAPTVNKWSSIMNINWKMRSRCWSLIVVIVDLFQIWNNYLCVIIDEQQLYQSETVVIRAVRLRRLNSQWLLVTCRLLCPWFKYCWPRHQESHCLQKRWTAKRVCPRWSEFLLVRKLFILFVNTFYAYCLSMCECEWQMCLSSNW